MSAFADLKIARCVESTLCAADATRPDIETLCAEAKKNSFRAVCVNGSRVELAYTLLEDSEVQVVALVGFPWGAGDTDAKRYETEIAIDQGAHEIDCVLNHGRLKDGDHRSVLRELRDIVEAAEERPVKFVLEPDLLDHGQKILACQLVLDSGAQFISLGTGLNADEAELAEVDFFRQTLGKTFGLKAVIGSRHAGTASSLLEAGAGRLGLVTGDKI